MHVLEMDATNRPWLCVQIYSLFCLFNINKLIFHVLEMRMLPPWLCVQINSMFCLINFNSVNIEWFLDGCYHPDPVFKSIQCFVWSTAITAIKWFCIPLCMDAFSMPLCSNPFNVLIVQFNHSNFERPLRKDAMLPAWSNTA